MLIEESFHDHVPCIYIYIYQMNIPTYGGQNPIVILFITHINDS